MANGINRVQVGGNLGGDPELRVTQGGTAVLSMSLACNETYLDRNRERRESTEWVKVVVWGKRAEGLAKFLKKGSWILVDGSLKTSKYTDREGIERWKTEVVARNVYLGGSSSARGNQSRGRNTGNDPEQRRPNRRDEQDDGSSDYGGGGGGYANEDYSSGGGDDDDIPFACVTTGYREPWWRF